MFTESIIESKYCHDILQYAKVTNMCSSKLGYAIRELGVHKSKGYTYYMWQGLFVLICSPLKKSLSYLLEWRASISQQ